MGPPGLHEGDLTDLYDAAGIGAVICDRAGRVLFANSAAEAIAAGGDTLVLRARELPIGARRSADAAGLLRLVIDAADGGAGGALCLESEAGRRVFALVAPLPPRFGGRPGHALIVLRPADEATSLDGGLLARLFGLTAAEAHVALAFMSDRSFAEIREARGVSENTLRTQLAHVMRKTDTTTQRQLVRLLSLLPMMQAPPPR